MDWTRNDYKPCITSEPTNHVLCKFPIIFKVCFMNSFQLFFIVSMSMSLWFFGFYWVFLFHWNLDLNLNPRLHTPHSWLSHKLLYQLLAMKLYISERYRSIIDNFLLIQWKFKIKTKIETMSLMNLFTLVLIWYGFYIFFIFHWLTQISVIQKESINNSGFVIWKCHCIHKPPNIPKVFQACLLLHI